MHILIAGATGAAGRALIPLLIANGHTVTGTTRTEAKTGELRALGANAQVMDGLDAASVKAAIDATQPDVIVHQMTALTGIDMKNIDKAFHLTNRLRTEGTEHILAAAKGKLLVAQSFAGWPYARTGGPGQDRGRPARPRPAEGHPRDPRGDPPPRRARHARPAASSCATAASTAPGPGWRPAASSAR